MSEELYVCNQKDNCELDCVNKKPHTLEMGCSLHCHMVDAKNRECVKVDSN